MSGGVRGGGATPPPTRFQYGSIRQWMAWGSADRLDSAAGDADKAKVEAAAGFDKNNWPNINNRSWGAEAFWTTGTTTERVTTPKTDTEREK